MASNRTDYSHDRRRLLLVTHCFDANFSMESRLSWARAVEAAREYDTTVVCAASYDEVPCDVEPRIEGVDVVPVPHTKLEQLLMKTSAGFYLAYRMWHRRVLRTARTLHSQRPFALVHQVSYCGFREPGYCWKLGVPFIWGPIGGTQNVPWRFLSQLDVLGAIKESCRSVTNRLQLHCGSRVGKALRTSSAVFVANGEVQQSFLKARGVHLPRQLETGVWQIDKSRPLSPDADRPLRILWSGRLEKWKALPLLLKAVAKLPDDCCWELRILGSGSQQAKSMRLADRLGLADRIEWMPLPDCGSRDEHYRWADVFAFTSLRDTSGTGLIESLAAGVPIVGLNHQGAADIMTAECAVPVAVDNPTQVIHDFRNALAELANDPERLARLSRGATLRAGDYHWDSLGSEMMSAYARALGDPVRATVKPAAKTEPDFSRVTTVAG